MKENRMGEQNNTEKKYESDITRWCRSVVCGSSVFIPDSEFGGEKCELTCDINYEF